jgi:hypothetical protein
MRPKVGAVLKRHVTLEVECIERFVADGNVLVLGVTFALLVATPILIATPLQEPPKAEIAGIVLQAGTNDPIPRAQLTLERVSNNCRGASAPRGARGATAPSPPATDSAANQPVFSDGDAKFTFKDLEACSYRLTGARNGYVKQQYGQRAVGRQGATIHLAAGQAMTDLVLRLKPAGNVSGHVRDSNGVPLNGLLVQLLRATYDQTGKRILQSAGSPRSTWPL